MDPFEKGLRGEIPLEAAADFFLKLKHGSVDPNTKKLARMKEKASQMGGLPATAMGQNMPPVATPALPAAAMGKHASDKRDTKVLDEAVKHNTKRHFQLAGATVMGGVGAMAGGLAGAASGALSSAKGKAIRGARRGGLGGAAFGGLSAGTVGAYQMGKAHDRHTAHGKKESKTAEAFRKAASDMFGDGMVAPGTVAPKVDMNQYMAMEEQGESAEQANQAEFLRQKLQEAQAELQAAQDQAGMAAQTQQQLEMQQSQHQQQLTAAQQQSQLATQAAMQNVEQAHQLAMQATTQALQAKDDAINTHALAASMRMSYQDLRGQIMDAVAQDNAAPVGEAIKAQGALAQTQPGAMGNDPNAPPGADPNAGAGGGPGDPADPNAQTGQQDGSAEQAPAAEAGPAAAAAPGTPQASGDGNSAAPLTPTAETGIKEDDQTPPAKTAGAGREMFGAAMNHLKSRAPYAAAGAALGGGLTAMESQMGNSGQHQAVSDIEQEPQSFGQALRLAAAKARATLGDAVREHPVAGTMFGAGVGAGAGMAMGPGIMDGFAKLPEHINTLRGKK